MQNIDTNQSFTAQLFVDNMPVTLAGNVIKSMLESPDFSEKEKLALEKQLELNGNILISYGENVIPETFLFAYHDDVYTIKIKGSDGQFQNTVSMEGELRNLSVFDGDDPTYFRIVSLGKYVNLDDMPNEFNRIRLQSGPQHREVLTYGEHPSFPILTDKKNRGRTLFLELKILQRHVSPAL